MIHSHSHCCFYSFLQDSSCFYSCQGQRSLDPIALLPSDPLTRPQPILCRTRPNTRRNALHHQPSCLVEGSKERSVFLYRARQGPYLSKMTKVSNNLKHTCTENVARDKGPVSQNLSSVTNDSLCYYPCYQHICHWFCHLSLKKNLCETGLRS